MTIRPMTPEDLEEVGTLAAEMVALHHAWDARRFFLPDSPAEGCRYWFGRELRRADAVLLAAEIDGRIAGYLYGTCEERDWNALRNPCGVVHDVLVSSAFRRHGVGKALMRAAIASFSERGITQVVLSTAAQNEAGQALFAALGFRPTMIEMTLDLEAPSSP